MATVVSRAPEYLSAMINLLKIIRKKNRSSFLAEVLEIEQIACPD